MIIGLSINTTLKKCYLPCVISRGEIYPVYCRDGDGGRKYFSFY